MFSLPQLIEEDIQQFDSALTDLLNKSEATAALIIDKGGPLVAQSGAFESFDTTTMAALAAGSFAATEAIASLVGEANFSSVYQQGETHSVIVHNVDDNLLLIVIFKAALSVGAVKYFAVGTVASIAQQILKARERSPDSNLDLVSMNLLDTADVFKRGGDEEETVKAAEELPPEEESKPEPPPKAKEKKSRKK